MPTRFILVVVLLQALTGCITVSLGGERRQDPAYDTVTPAGAWEPLPEIEIARTYKAKDTGSILGVSSACDEVRELPFEQLLENVTASVPEREITVPAHDLSAANYPGRVIEVRGKRHQEPVEMVAMVLKSDHCVYDVTLTGTRLTAVEKAEALRVAQSLKERPLK